MSCRSGKRSSRGPRGRRTSFISSISPPLPPCAARAKSRLHDLQETRTALALQFALGQFSKDRLARLLVLSDGYATESLSGITRPLMKSGVPLDYRLLVDPTGVDYQVTSVEAPQRVQMGESFMVEARITGTQDAVIDCQIARDGQTIGNSTATVKSGEARLRFADRLAGPGAHRYSVRIAPVKDAHPENNEGQAWVEAIGGSRVLLVSAYEHDPVADILTGHGFEVDQVTDTTRLNAGSLTGTRLVILNNVPSHRLPDEFLHGLDFYVREQGGGLLMGGGRFSFGSGGYFSSVIDPLLPVSMELKKEHRKLRVAMAIVMDRSGSMGVSVSSGGKTITKMDLADEGAARSAALLGDSDLLSIVAVDSEAHHIVPLTEVGPARDDIDQKVRHIASQGGGIFIGVALKAGWKELQKTEAGQRHLILFADACDSEEPADYEKTVAEMTAQGVTVSVIGMGSDHDVDSALLQKIAALGNGRSLFNADVSELPGALCPGDGGNRPLGFH